MGDQVGQEDCKQDRGKSIDWTEWPVDESSVDKFSLSDSGEAHFTNPPEKGIDKKQPG